MLHENLKNFRKAKGLSQEELAAKINVVRQTVSKWEKGLSVPDSELLLLLAEALDTDVNTLLGETVSTAERSEIQQVAEKLELLNEQFAKRNEQNRRLWRGLCIAACVVVSGWFLLELAEVLVSALVLRNAMGDVGIIGGADGPTSIFVASASPSYLPFIVAGVLLVLAVIGICRTRRK